MEELKYLALVWYVTNQTYLRWIKIKEEQSHWKTEASKLDSRSPPGARFWQNFEHFVVTFRCLKSRVIKEGELTTISEVHAGACLNGDIKFINHHLELGIASNQEPTDSNNSNSNIKCEHATINIWKGRHCIINCMSA